MTHKFDSEVSLRYWMVWPKVRRLAVLPPLLLLLNGSSVFEGHPSTKQKK